MANLPPDRRIQLQSNTGTNVINGAAGTAQPTATPNQPQQAQQGVTTNTQGAAPQQAQNNSQKSSGMFTNIKSYIQRNQPQAQKMAGAVTGDFSKQATQIADQAKRQEQQFKNQIQTQQGNIQSQADFAQGIIDQTKNLELGEGQMANAETTQNVYANKPPQVAPAPVVEGQQPVPQPTGPTPEEIAKQSQDNFDKFQGIITGANEQDLYNVQDLDLSRQQNKAQQLGALAKSAGTEQGRAALLDQAFSKNKQYTTGQAGLDTAILGGNQQALKSVQDLTKQSTQGIEQDLKQKYFQSLSDRAKLQSTAENLKKDVAGRVEGAMGDVVKQAEDEATAIRDQAVKEQESARNKFRTGEGLTEEDVAKYVNLDKVNQTKNNVSNVLKSGNLKGAEKMLGKEFTQEMKKYSETIGRKFNHLSSKEKNKIFNAYLKERPGENYDQENVKNWWKNSQMKNKMLDMEKGISSPTDLQYMKDLIKRGSQEGLLNFASTEDITAQSSASEKTLAQYEALKRLSNNTGVGLLDMNKERVSRGPEVSGSNKLDIEERTLWKQKAKR